MANEERLIDANEAMEYAQKVFSDPVLLYAIKTVLDNASTVDAVEVVRCKDCRHYLSGYCNYFGYYDYAPEVNAEGFCSNAWKKDGDGNA